MEAQSWRRGFTAGFAALFVSIAGQVATSTTVKSCPLAAPEPGLAEQVIEHLKPAARAHGFAQRVALAVLEAMLHRTCS